MAAGDVRVGVQGTFNQEVGVKRDIDEAIVILPVDDVPLQRFIGSEPTNSIEVEWLEEDLTPQVVTATGVSGTASPWTLSVADGDSEPFRPGDVLWKQGAASDIQYRVSAVDHTANTLTVTSFGATDDDDDPQTSDVFELIGQYRDEGSDPEQARSVERRIVTNYTQIGQERVEATRTARKQARFGAGDPYSHEVMKKFKELGIRFERSMVHGYKVRSNDHKRRAMGGLLYYITTNTESGNASAVKTEINQLVRAAYEAGGKPRHLFVSPAVKVAISANFDNSIRQSNRSDRVAGYVVDTILTDFGEVDVITNRHLPTKKGILVQREFLKRKSYDPYFHEMLAKTGDADVGQIVGEHAIEVKNEVAHGVLTVSDAS